MMKAGCSGKASPSMWKRKRLWTALACRRLSNIGVEDAFNGAQSQAEVREKGKTVTFEILQIITSFARRRTPLFRSVVSSELTLLSH